MKEFSNARFVNEADSNWVHECLSFLSEASCLAASVRRDGWDFAVEIKQLGDLGFNHSRLRWLICRTAVFAVHQPSSFRENSEIVGVTVRG